ncbi:MAG: hypothetical protein JWN84_101 [Nocardioides sp.]|jgi:diacylglycerol O-acyltransferase/trehalose O-mycolyltransferase|nr:hypothetical protein [Nocardioides sp.]
MTVSLRPLARGLAALTTSAVLATAAWAGAAGTTADAVGARAAADEGPVTVVRSDAQRDPLAAWATYARLMAVPSYDTGKVPAVRAPREGGGVACPPSRCVDRRVPVPRGVKVTDNTVRVLLPVGYRAPRNADRRYPVVFLWNGGQSRSDGWSLKTELTEMSRAWPAILVMPEGGFGRQAGFFSDWHDGSFDWETFHTEVVVPWVDRTFRTIKGARAAVGASMGAIGAINYAAHNPTMFKAVLSISGALDTTTMATYGIDPALSAALGFADPDLRRIWGDPVRDRANWRRHNPQALVPRLRGVEVLVASGTGYLAPASDGIYNGTFENTLWNTQRSFFQAMTAHGIPYKARVMVGGVHDWPWFNHPLEWGVPQLVRAALRGR